MGVTEGEGSEDQAQVAMERMRGLFIIASSMLFGAVEREDCNSAV